MLMGQPIQSSIFNFQCYLLQLNFELELVYQEFVIACLLPFVYFVLFYGIIRLHYRVLKESFSNYVMISASLFILFYVQPDLFSRMIKLISCIRIGKSDYLLANVNHLCYTSEFYKWIFILVLPAMIVYLIGIPFSFFFIIYKNRLLLNDPMILLKYEYLILEYKKSKYYWEFIKMTQRILIIFVLNYYFQNIISKYCILLGTMILYYSLL